MPALTVFLPTRPVTPLILTMTCLPTALVTVTLMTRLVLRAVALGSGAAETVMVKVVVAWE